MGRRPSARQFWLRYASRPRGRLILDEGAVRAVRERHASLLAAGITGVSGDFLADDPVELVGPDGVVVARGLVAYDAREMPPLLGRKTGDLAPEYRREVVHRDEMVLVGRRSRRLRDCARDDPSHPRTRRPGAAHAVGRGDGLRRLAGHPRARPVETVDHPGRAGLAAPQIGVSARVFSYNIDGVIGHMVNPVIVERSEETQDGDEGCLSVPGIWAPTVRAMHVVVEGFDVDGKPLRLEGEGLMARCLQHEVDHLDGKVFLDRLTGEARKSALRALRAR